MQTAKQKKITEDDYNQEEEQEHIWNLQQHPATC